MGPLTAITSLARPREREGPTGFPLGLISLPEFSKWSCSPSPALLPPPFPLPLSITSGRGDSIPGTSWAARRHIQEPPCPPCAGASGSHTAKQSHSVPSRPSLSSRPRRESDKQGRKVLPSLEMDSAHSQEETEFSGLPRRPAHPGVLVVRGEPGTGRVCRWGWGDPLP